jgi:hypothetical protein
LFRQTAIHTWDLALRRDMLGYVNTEGGTIWLSGNSRYREARYVTAIKKERD